MNAATLKHHITRNIEYGLSLHSRAYQDVPSNQSPANSMFGGRLRYVPFGISLSHDRGHLINYASRKMVGKNNAMMRRHDLVFNALKLYTGFETGYMRNAYVAIHNVYVDTSDPLIENFLVNLAGNNRAIAMREIINKDYGTFEEPDRLVYPNDSTVWPMDIHTAYVGFDAQLPFIMTKTTSLRKRSDFSSMSALANALLQDSNAIHPDFGYNDDNAPKIRYMNSFFVLASNFIQTPQNAPFPANYMRHPNAGYEFGDEVEEMDPENLWLRAIEEEDEELPLILPIVQPAVSAEEFELNEDLWNQDVDSFNDINDLDTVRRFGAYNITADPSASVTLSSKAAYTPEDFGRKDCMWECILFFLAMRGEQEVDTSKWYYADFALPGMNIVRTTSSKRRRSTLKIWASRNASILANRYACMVNRHSLEFLPCDIKDVDGILQFFDALPSVILNSECEVMHGELESPHLRRMANNQITLIDIKGHVSVVISYVGCLHVSKCYRCDLRFSSSQALEKHLGSAKCMTCACLGGGHFKDEAIWRDHVNNRMELCPRYDHSIVSSELPASADVVVRNAAQKKEKTKRDRKRFPHDQSALDYYVKKRDEQNELEKDRTDYRNHSYAIFFDLETLVPMNEKGTPCSEQQFQTPYAAGWSVFSADSANESEVRVSYGLNCIEDFISFLDDLHVSIVANERAVWFARAQEGLEVTCVPKQTRAMRNYAMRVKDCWMREVKDMQSEGCLYCLEPMELDHGFTEHPYIEGGFMFSECALNVFAHRTANKNIETNFNNNAPRITIWAHNGGKFDWLFIHRHIMEKNRLHEVKTVRSQSKYFELHFRNIFIFKDSMNFLMGSLDKLGKDFKVETLKGIFPYRLMSSSERLELTLRGEEDIRKTIPHDYLMIKEKVDGYMGFSRSRAMTETEYKEFFESRDWTYSVREETIKYLRDDVKCLQQIMLKFRMGWKEMPFSPELFSSCTIGQLSHSYFLNNFLEPGIFSVLNVCEDAYVRRALFGGRTEVFKRVAEEGSRIHYIDVNSLYPAVMESCKLPCGDPVWHFREDDCRLGEFSNTEMRIDVLKKPEAYFDRLRDVLNMGEGGLETSEPIFGYIEVDIRMNMTDKYPVLPERRKMKGSAAEKNMFTNCSKFSSVYYTEEVKLAIQQGAVVDRVISFSQWGAAKVYESVVKVLKTQKLRGEGKDVNGQVIEGLEKNPALRGAGKLASNALFGKTIQFINESVQLVTNHEDLFKAIETPFTNVSVMPLMQNESVDVVEVTTKFTEPKMQKRSCAAIGAAILAEARIALYRYFIEVQRIGGSILYCDTDSIVYSGEGMLPQHLMHDSAYGKMKVEIPPDDIERGGFVAVSPKCYAFKLRDGSPYVRCKGVNLSSNVILTDEEEEKVEDEGAEGEMEELMNAIQDEEFLEKHSMDPSTNILKGICYENLRALATGTLSVLRCNQMQFRKTKDRRVAAIDTEKCIRGNFDKRLVVSKADGETVPWNDYNLEMDRIIENQDSVAFSNFLNSAMYEDVRAVALRFSESSFVSIIMREWLRSDHVSAMAYKFYLDQIGESW